jgi:predicted nucleic acid-binding protein
MSELKTVKVNGRCQISFPLLALADITRDVARQAAQLRAKYNVRPADALQVTAAAPHPAAFRRSKSPPSGFATN